MTKISLHKVMMDTFGPNLESMSSFLDIGAAHAQSSGQDLVNARLAPDMFTLAQQVQVACYFVRETIGRLSGEPAATNMGELESSFEGMKAQIAGTLEALKATREADFEGAGERDCSIDIPTEEGIFLDFDGTRFLLNCVLPNFYFHVSTAYDILRHHGVVLGKRDFMSSVGAFVKKRP